MGNDLRKGSERVRADAVLHEIKVEMVAGAVTCTAYIADTIVHGLHDTPHSAALKSLGAGCHQPP